MANSLSFTTPPISRAVIETNDQEKTTELKTEAMIVKNLLLVQGYKKQDIRDIAEYLVEQVEDGTNSIKRKNAYVTLQEHFGENEEVKSQKIDNTFLNRTKLLDVVTIDMMTEIGNAVLGPIGMEVLHLA